MQFSGVPTERYLSACERVPLLHLGMIDNFHRGLWRGQLVQWEEVIDDRAECVRCVIGLK